MNTSDIASSLQRFWVNNGPVGILTHFSGTDVDVINQERWCEFWISQLNRLTHRQFAPNQYRLLIDIHFFSRSVDKRVIHQWLDDASQLFQAAPIPISSHLNVENRIGELRCMHQVVRDLTRENRAEAYRTLQHMTLSLQAIVTVRKS